MTDLTNYSLNDWQVYAFDRMRVKLFTHDNGQTYIDRRYWHGITEKHRELLIKVAETFADKRAANE